MKPIDGRRSLSALTAALAAVAVGCAPVPQTEIVVVLSTDLPRGTVLRSVHVVAQRSGATSPLHDQDYPLIDTRFPLPGEVVLVARDPEDTRPITVRVVGDLGAQRVQQDAVVRFQREHTLYLQMTLSSGCIGRDCGEGLTCRLGTCASPGQAPVTDTAPTNLLRADATVDVPMDVNDATAPEDRPVSDGQDASNTADAVDDADVTDATDGGVGDVDDAADVSQDRAADVTTEIETPDVPSDIQVDVLVDVPTDMGADASIDVVSDAPDSAIDVPTDIARDVTAEASIDAAADVPSDASVDGPGDVITRVDGSCLTTETRCGSACIDLTSDPTNCGVCGRVCASTSPGAQATCVAGVCGERCPLGTISSAGECVFDQARPVYPISGVRHPNRRPGFAWRGATGVSRALLEVCRTQACATPEYSAEVTGDTTVTAPLDPGVHFWRVTGIRGDLTRQSPSPWWSFRLTSRATTTATTSWGNFTDFNGDGFVDLLLQTSPTEYSIRLGLDRSPWFMDAGTLRVPPVMLTTSTAARVSLARAVGDLNGDGRGDIAVIARYGTSPSRDVVYVYFGADSGVNPSPQTVLTTASSTVLSTSILDVTAAGDADFDGYGDLAISYRESAGRVRIRVWMGRWFGLMPTPARELLTTGTFTGALRGWAFRTDDPFPDILAQEESPSVWAMFHSGIMPTPAPTGYTRFDLATVPGSCDPQWVGTTNADGRARVFCSSVITAGAARYRHALYGNSDLAQLTEVARRDFSTASPEDIRTARGVGDVNGDGSDDFVLISRSGGSPTLRGWVSPGAAGAFGADAPLPSGLCDESVFPLGDVNRDGIDDFYAGCRMFFGRADTTWSSVTAPSVTLGGNKVSEDGLCPAGMRQIPGGTFVMGSSLQPDERPTHTVRLSQYCMDSTEVTVAEYARCPSSICSAPVTGIEFTWGVSGRENRPVNGVDFAQARAYCRWRGSDLPTEAQWEFAARGTDERTYPWGNTPAGAQPCWSLAASQGGCAVATHTLGDSFFGLSDMAGNVGEWVLDWYGPYPSEATPPLLNPSGPPSGINAIARGGAFDVTSESLIRTTFRAPFYQPAYQTFYIGFRCASPAP